MKKPGHHKVPGFWFQTLAQNAKKKKPGAGTPGNELPSDYADQLFRVIAIYNTIFK